MAQNMEKAVSDYRYERKFFISDLTLDEVKLLVKLHPVLFSEIYHQRYINNIYLDSLEMKSYFDNIDGAADRLKVRIRWYGELFGPIEKPILELKIKKGLLGTKRSYLLNAFSLDSSFSSESLIHLFKNADIPEHLKLQLISLKPSLINRYSRNYYRSSDGDYRVTLDDGMQFYSINSWQNNYLHKAADIGNIVLELKYNQDKDQRAKHMVTLFPFRMTRSSKYLNGIKKLTF